MTGSDRDDGAAALVPPRAGDGVADGAGTAGLYQYLAVFILLLGFFILLNSMARLEEARVGRVLESVEDAFSTAVDPAGGATDRAREAALAEAARSVRALGDLLLSDLPLAKVDGSGEGGTFALVLPLGELFRERGGQLALRTDRVALLNRVAEVMLPRPGGVQVELEALLSVARTAETPPALVPAAGALARGLARYGAPESALTVGFEPGRPGMIRLLFTISADRPPVRVAPHTSGGAS